MDDKEQDMSRISMIDGLFDSLFEDPRRWPEWRHWIEVRREGADVVVRAALAGYGPDDVVVDHDGTVLAIQASKGGRTRSARVTVGTGEARAAMEHGELVVRITPSAQRNRVAVGSSLAALGAVAETTEDASEAAAQNGVDEKGGEAAA